MLPELLFSFSVVVDLSGAGMCSLYIFDKSWIEEIPKDKTGDFDMIYGFLRENWNIVKWVALGIVIFEALLFVLALIVRAANRPPEYDSDEEYINPRQQVRQPLLNRPAGTASGVPVTGTVDQRPSRNDAWSTRMREKYGLDTSEFTYNPSESNRFQQANSQPTEERSRCTIM
ncbi:Tobamovirus multiplication protein 2A [Spatholobus suberectus]|nr:Tobamovirus multiplication protein 2A [Spatholobus suberectus]